MRIFASLRPVFLRAVRCHVPVSTHLSNRSPFPVEDIPIFDDSVTSTGVKVDYLLFSLAIVVAINDQIMFCGCTRFATSCRR
jgi:hypothetical protein